MGRKSIKEQRRREIVVAFCEVAEKQGVESTSLSQVAAHMGINGSLILHYFSSKEELLSEVNEYILDRYLTLFDQHLDQSRGSISNLLDTLFSTKWNDLISDGVYYDLYAMSFRNPSFRQSFAAIHESLHWRLANILEEATKKGETTITDFYETAVDIFTLIDGWYYHLVMIDDPTTLDRKRKRMIAKVHEMLKNQ